LADDLILRSKKRPFFR